MRLQAIESRCRSGPSSTNHPSPETGRQVAFGTDLAASGSLRRRKELTGSHRVECFRSLFSSSLPVIFLRGHGGHPVVSRRCCDLRREFRHTVHMSVVLPVPPTPVTRPTTISFVPPPSPRVLRGEGAELVHHRVDGFFSSRSALHVHGDICSAHRAPPPSLPRRVKHLGGAVDRHRVHVVVRSFQVPATPSPPGRPDCLK